MKRKNRTKVVIILLIVLVLVVISLLYILNFLPQVDVTTLPGFTLQLPLEAYQTQSGAAANPAGGVSP